MDLSPLKDNMQMRLMLSYYGQQLTPTFINEGYISTFIVNYFEKTGLNPVDTPIELDNIVKLVDIYSELLNNEHMNDFSKMGVNSVIKRLQFLEKKGMVAFSKGLETIVVKDEKFMLTCRFFALIVQPLIDTYFTLLVAIDQIAGKQVSLNEETLV